MAGSCPTYLGIVMETAYTCRLHGIDVGALTDVHLSDQGLRTNRRKSSRDNIVAWGPRLRAAVTEDERFSLHDLKRKGITDYKGTRAEKTGRQRPPLTGDDGRLRPERADRAGQ